MLEGYIIFFTRIFDYALILQMLTVSLSTVLVLSPFKMSGREFLIAAAKVLGIFTAELIVLSFLFSLSMISGNVFLRSNCFFLVHIICIVLYSLFFCKYNARVKIIMVCTLSAIAVTMIEVGSLFGKICEMAAVEAGNNFDWMGFMKIVSPLLTIAFAVIQAKWSMKRYSDVPVGGMAIILIGTLLTTSMILLYESTYSLYGWRENVKYHVFPCIMFVVLYVINIVSYIMIYLVCKERNNVIELKAEKQLAEVNAEMVQLSEKNLSYIRQLRHDIKNQYSYINMLLDNDQYDDVRKYFKSLGDDIIQPLSYIDSGNKNVDAILNMEMSKANAYDVNFDSKVVVPPRLPFSDSALCSIISNLIDNAIEACIRLGMQKEGVMVQVNPRQDYLYICVENILPTNTEKDKLLSLITAKTDTLEHGIGTRIVKRLVEKYNGYVTFAIEEDKFIAEVMLDLMNDEK